MNLDMALQTLSLSLIIIGIIMLAAYFCGTIKTLCRHDKELNDLRREFKNITEHHEEDLFKVFQFILSQLIYSQVQNYLDVIVEKYTELAQTLQNKLNNESSENNSFITTANYRYDQWKEHIQEYIFDDISKWEGMKFILSARFYNINTEAIVRMEITNAINDIILEFGFTIDTLIENLLGK